MQREKSAVPLPHTRPVVPWNRGRFVGPKPPLKPKQVWAIRLHLQREQRLRDLALLDLAIDSKLRGCDLVKLEIGEVAVDAAARHRATVVQKSLTGAPAASRRPAARSRARAPARARGTRRKGSR